MCIYLEKYDKYLRLESLVVWGKVLAIKYIYNIFFKQNLMIIYICKSLKLRIKASFLVHNNYLNLCRQVDNFKWILCSPNTDVNCGYLRFLRYKVL